MLQRKISGKMGNAQEKKGLSTSGLIQHIDATPIYCMMTMLLENILLYLLVNSLFRQASIN